MPPPIAIVRHAPHPLHPSPANARKGSRPTSNYSPLVQHILTNRGVSDDEFNFRLEDLIPPDSLRGINDALALLLAAMDQHERVLIVGDYDCDGATATALFVSVLRSLKFQVAYLVPNRETMGYGLSLALAQQIGMHPPDLVITVDNGIASFEGIAHLRSLGVKVLITDHHLSANTLPNANAIVNPNQPDCSFPSKNLCGVGVVFYVLLALRRALRARGYADFSLGPALDLVAVGTLADVVRLDRNNRLLVHFGLKRIREGRARPGINALFRMAGRRLSTASSTDIGFFVAPRINAAGRMADMTLGIECLLADSADSAMALATQLDTINHERRATEETMRHEALSLLPTLSLPENTRTITLCQAHWHMGVIGIVAARVKEVTHKPTFIFAQTASGLWRGSGRSVVGVHLRDCLDYMAKRRPHLFLAFGGHAMAAGASIADDHINLFAPLFDEAVQALYEQPLTPTCLTDGPLAQVDFNWANMNTLDQLIWGQGFPAPIFDDVFDIEMAERIRKKNSESSTTHHWKFRVRNERLRAQALYFNAPNDFNWTPQQGRAHLVFGLIHSEYQGRTDINLRIEYWQTVAED